MNTINKLLAISSILLLIMSCSSEEVDELQDPAPNDNVSDGSGDGGQTTATVFERLQGSTFRQQSLQAIVRLVKTKLTITFQFRPLQITGTKPDNTCEQNDVQPIGTCSECATVEEDSVDKLTLCLGPLCQTITFVSEDEIQFDFSAAGETWTAQRYTENPPCKDWNPVGDGEDTVLGRLKGKTYQQIETVNVVCVMKKLLYVFDDGQNYRDYLMVCEQNDYTSFGDDIDIELNTTDELRICIGTFPLRLCQTITFLSDTEIHFDFPAFNQTWTAQLYTDDVPCTDWIEGTTTTNPIYSGVFGGAVYDNGTFLFPSSNSQTWAGFANEDTGLYPLSFPNGGKVTFNAATEGATDIVVKFVFERLPFDAEGNGAADTQPSFETLLLMGVK